MNFKGRKPFIVIPCQVLRHSQLQNHLPNTFLCRFFAVHQDYVCCMKLFNLTALQTRSYLEIGTTHNLVECSIQNSDTFLVARMAEGTFVFSSYSELNNRKLFNNIVFVVREARQKLQRKIWMILSFFLKVWLGITRSSQSMLA